MDSIDCSGSTGRLPHRARAPPPNHTEVSQEAPSAPMEMRVLAVDDNNIDRKLIEMLLKTSSFKGIHTSFKGIAPVISSLLHET